MVALKSNSCVESLAVGEESLVMVDRDGIVSEWALPDHQASVHQTQPRATLHLPSPKEYGQITCIEVCH